MKLEGLNGAKNETQLEYVLECGLSLASNFFCKSCFLESRKGKSKQHLRTRSEESTQQNIQSNELRMFTIISVQVGCLDYYKEYKKRSPIVC